MDALEVMNKNVVVMGLGRFGGGIAAARWLVGRGAKVTVTDMAPAEKLADSVAQLAGLPVTFHLGGHDTADLDGCDLLVVSPAVPKDKSDFVKQAIAHNIPLSSEMNLFIQHCPARRIVGITGSAGKSTTTAMLGAILAAAERGGIDEKVQNSSHAGRGSTGKPLTRSAGPRACPCHPAARWPKEHGHTQVRNNGLGPAHATRPNTGLPVPPHTFARAWVGGNIGCSLLDELENMSADDIVVLELSSFQLEDLGHLKWSPSHAIVTNIKPNHLDRHGTLEVYADAKMNIVRFQRPEDIVFVHGGDEELAERVRRVGAASRLARYEFDACFQPYLQVPGRHNQVNAAAAVAVARELGINDERIAQGLANFRGLPHRLEFVAERGGVRFYNDSKSTTPESTQIAVEAFDCPAVVMVGGGDKGMPFDALARLLAKQAKATVCYGATGPMLYDLLCRYIDQGERSSRVALVSGDMAAAVGKAAEFARPGDVVVLSPACTSYDMFTNYEQRGDTFREAVLGLSD